MTFSAQKNVKNNEFSEKTSYLLAMIIFRLEIFSNADIVK